jgi:chromosome segregation ATPase
LDEAIDAQRETEKVANEAINAQTSQEQEMHNLAKEREELQTTIESLQQQLENLSGNHENYLLQHQGDIDDFHSKLGNAVDSQRTLEQMTDDAVTAYQSEVEKTRALAFERDELQMMIETLQSDVQSLEQDHDDHMKRYQQEIRQLRMTLEGSSEEKRSVQKAADDARFELETQAEKFRALIVERDELRSSLTSVKGSAKKNYGDHTDYLRRHKHEIQQLHDKLDEALGDKLAVEKSADEIQFAKDDLDRKLENVKDDLSACRADNIRLEGIRREEQDTIQKMNAELRKKDSERIDIEKFQNELQRLKRHKDHLESLVAHRKVEYSGVLKDLEEECTEAKSRNLELEEELSSTRIELSSSQEQKGEMAEKLKSLYDTSSRLSRELCEKDETVERLQSSYTRLESLRKEDQETIRNLNEEMRKRESESFDVDQLHHIISRLKQDRDHLQNLLESSNLEYERSMDERANEISEYENQVDTIKKDLEEALQSNKMFQSDAKAQLRSLQESESNLIQNLRQRDAKIDRLQDEIAKQKEEVSSLREREASYSGSAEHEITHLKKQVYNLEINLESTIQEKEESLGRVKNESRSHKAVLGELERSRDEVHRLKLTLTNLNEELDDRQQDALRADEKIYQMESTLRKFKAETKARVGTLMGRENDSSAVLERTRHENRDLTDNLQYLHDMIEKLRRERDVCFQSLKDGQKKLSQLSSKNSVYGLDDILETPPKQMGSRYRESANTTTPRSSSRPPFESVTARSSRTPSAAFPEIYVTNYNLGDAGAMDMSTRAEEIAAYVAISARKSLEKNQEEVSQLRSQIYRLEDEKSVEVSALKTKVRTLEKELSYERVVENASTSIYDNSGTGHRSPT